MSNLINYQGELTTLAEKRFESPALKNIPENKLKGGLLDLISMVHFKCGYRIEDDDLELMLNLLYEELTPYHYLTVTELETVFNKGYKEEYGEYFGLSVKTFIGWVERYVKEHRQEELAKRRKVETLKPLPEMSETTKEELLRNGIVNCFEEYAKTKSILAGYVWVYEHLFDLGLIQPSDDDKKMAYKAAMRDLKKESKDLEYVAAKQLMDAIRKPKSDRVIIEAKNLLVKRYFDGLLRQDKHINDVL